jgi:hypothetical protein
MKWNLSKSPCHHRALLDTFQVPTRSAPFRPHHWCAHAVKSRRCTVTDTSRWTYQVMRRRKFGSLLGDAIGFALQRIVHGSDLQLRLQRQWRGPCGTCRRSHRSVICERWRRTVRGRPRQMNVPEVPSQLTRRERFLEFLLRSMVHFSRLHRGFGRVPARRLFIEGSVSQHRACLRSENSGLATSVDQKQFARQS